MSKAFKTDLDHLKNFVAADVWGARRLELLDALLLKIADYLGYEFSELGIKREVLSTERACGH